MPGWGAKPAAAVLARYGSLEAIPAKASARDVPRLSGAPILAQTLRERWDEVQLYPSLARLRTVDDGIVIPQQAVGEPRWSGVPKSARETFCVGLGLEQYVSRPHRWEAAGAAH